MLSNFHISRTLREIALRLDHDINALDLRFIDTNTRDYHLDELSEFKRDLIEAGNKLRILLAEIDRTPEELTDILTEEYFSVLAFTKMTDGVNPVFISNKQPSTAIVIERDQNIEAELNESFMRTLVRNERGSLLCFAIHTYQNLVSSYSYDDGVTAEPMHPLRRLFRLLNTERKTINYILFYAIGVGLIGLVLPLGIQAIVELISGGLFFSSVYVLIGLVILGVLFAGVLQLVQITLVENLQRRVFTKAALEFAFRIPRIRLESLFGSYGPELVNRFFDVINIQKSLPKVLIDLSSATIQILAGLLLLSLYHPFFIFFSAVLLGTLFVIFYLTGPRGLQSSINESKYKYKVAQWLEELARALNSFKLAGNSDLPLNRTDHNVTNYLKYRKSHFKILMTQFSAIVFFKALITGGLLIVGTFLVVDRQITLGQFVASEIVIILILNSVEKLITYMDEIYDLITAVDKVSHVTDMPLDRTGGIDFPKQVDSKGFSLVLKNLSYTYPNGKYPTINNLNLEIPSGERVCIAGPGGSGKTTLTNIISGFQSSFTGIVTINGFSIRDLDLTHLRDSIAKNISHEDIFDGTILENITVGKPMESPADAVNALKKVHLDDRVNELPEGLHTHLVSGGKGFSSTFISRLILARCLAKRPQLIILNDFFEGMKKSDKLDLIEMLTDHTNHWTLLAVSNDPVIMSACDRVAVLANGKIVADGNFEDLMKQGAVQNYLD